MKNPPNAIKVVLAAVCIMKNIKPDRVTDPNTGRKVIFYLSLCYFILFLIKIIVLFIIKNS